MKQKAQRGVSFIAEEDTVLVLAWLSISMDPIRGTDQSSSQMWSRIYEYYSTYKKPNCQERFIASLTNQLIRQNSCTKRTSNITLPVDHCWNLLRHQPKWQAHMDLIKKKNGSSLGITPNSIPLGKDVENVPVNYLSYYFLRRKLELEIKAEEDRSDLVTLKKRKIDIEIMSKEIDSLNGVQQEYFHNLQMEITEEQRNWSISRM
ncbi:hypothetical protein CIPAW_04G065100 [Carya illinoinensis]|uniref:No apical meristem-associated C-terminal domain-containing protein n=1 Tax=Carya illinoinensis TaxID=32201 RepID=A0A8T1QSG0_CARIL|nr:hypothetical protein CIPAW_04G065100 [Carya illinoinensis]